MEKRSERKQILIFGMITILLLVAVTGFTIKNLRNHYAKQMTGLIGKLSQTSEVNKETLDVFCTGEYVDRDYEMGRTLLLESGYGESGVLLLGLQLDKICILLCVGFFLAFLILFLGIFIQSHRRKLLFKSCIAWVRHPKSQELFEKVGRYATRESRELILVIREQDITSQRALECLHLEKEHTIAYVEDISHQLKTPLSVLNVYMQLMDGKEEHMQESKHMIKTQIEKMSNLVNMMMEMGKLNSDKTVMDIQKQYLECLIEEISSGTGVLCHNKEIKLEQKIKGREVFYYDSYWMKQALLNLVKNSVEHSEPNGRIRILYEVNDVELKIRLSDEGAGIEEEQLEHLFERFVSDYRKKDASSGLGLAITKRVVENHFGEITVENNPERGVTFTIYIPRMQGAVVYQNKKKEEFAIDGNIESGTCDENLRKEQESGQSCQ